MLSSLAQLAVCGASYGERFSLSPLRPVVLSTGFFAERGFQPSPPCPRTASTAEWDRLNQAEAVGFASVRQMMIPIWPYSPTRPGAICSLNELPAWPFDQVSRISEGKLRPTSPLQYQVGLYCTNTASALHSSVSSAIFCASMMTLQNRRWKQPTH